MTVYDPVELGSQVKKQVCRRKRDVWERRVYRYRVDRWYGGILTADVVGCNLRCRFCWAWRTSSYRTGTGVFQPPGSIVSKLAQMREKYGINKARLSGGEPLLCPEHSLETAVMAANRGFKFIIETNGILLRKDEADRIVNVISRNKGIMLRISLKGCSPSSFHVSTGAPSDYFSEQIGFIEQINDKGLRPGKHFWVAVMVGFCEDHEIESLADRLSEISKEIIYGLEIEEIILYPHVKRLMETYGVKPRRYVRPW